MSGTKKTAASKEVAVIKVKFIVSPTGRFKLAYSVGEVGELPKLQAEELIEAGYAEVVK